MLPSLTPPYTPTTATSCYNHHSLLVTTDNQQHQCNRTAAAGCSPQVATNCYGQHHTHISLGIAKSPRYCSSYHCYSGSILVVIGSSYPMPCSHLHRSCTIASAAGHTQDGRIPIVSAACHTQADRIFIIAASHHHRHTAIAQLV